MNFTAVRIILGVNIQEINKVIKEVNMFYRIDFTAVILSNYAQTWFLWIGFIIFGFLVFKFSEHISFSSRDNRKKENAGISMMAIGIVIHIFVAVAFVKSI